MPDPRRPRPACRAGRSRRPRAALLALIAALALPPLPGAAQSPLPALGDAASEHLGVGDERRLGDMIMADIRRDPAFLDDAVLQDYIERLWSPLLAAARRQGHIGPELESSFSWDPFLVRDPSVNAFALPGGHVGVHLGLIAMTRHPDELASVLAHELVHVTQRHIARSVESAQKLGPVGIAAMLLGVLAAARSGNADAAQAVIAGGQAVMIQGQLNFSRDMEREADRIGYAVLQGAGYSPLAMTSMFEMLAAANRLNDSGAFPYLRSHPLTAERIADARDRAAGLPPAAPVPLLHALMAARAQVLMDSTTATLRRWQSTDAGGAAGVAGAAGAARADEPAIVSAYRQVLVATGLRDALAAGPALARLQRLADAPDVPDAARRAVRWLAAESLAAFGQADAALALLDPEDGTRPAQFLRAEVHRRAFRPDDPRRLPALRADLQALQARVADRPGDGPAWHQLSLSAAAAGQPLRALRAGAEAALAAGDLAGAVERLRAAQRSGIVSEPFEAQIVDARLRALEALRREQMAAQSGRAGGR